MPPERVLVAGATGRQGGAVARHLLERGVEVHALTRDGGSDAARELDERGAVVVEGDLGEKESLVHAVRDVDGVYGVTTWAAGLDAEVEQGTNLGEVAADHGVDHFVFSSVWGANENSGVPFFDTKATIERRLSDLDLPLTVVRPVFFMQNLEGMRDDIMNETLSMALEPRTPLYMVDVDDIGAIVAEAFAKRANYVEREIDLAGDELTLSAMAVRLSKSIGIDVTADHVPIDAFEKRAGEDYAAMYRWFNRGDAPIDLAELRSSHDVQFTLFEEYLDEHEWSGSVG
ncbi:MULTISPECIES: NmrA/HSCARG family protein [unclassified Haladaptatus]|uniref:NmrA/HSCARG family protein n=1 Tax=unclassified Haladaptatus TaxID=2622732 RepID=UPI00209BFF12|nr:MULTISPECIES: NmrA/HSCARG family protein [unclassified Haladaptatus]MCO8244393.1 NmrA/HSCARG family protein [Haladaptatus sp. AB643]MCO8253984.1 NmrA/HSCARG family protein [Haladaptatus sp. AB618]